MSEYIKCWGCGNNTFTDETHYKHKTKEACCLKCGRFLADKDGAVFGFNIQVFDRIKKKI